MEFYSTDSVPIQRRPIGGGTRVSFAELAAVYDQAQADDALWRLLAFTASAAEEQFTNANVARDRTPPPLR